MRTLKLPAPRTAFSLLVACAALAGCAGTQKPKAADVVWPPPPETARIKWVRSFATEEDLGGSALRSIGRAFLPLESGTSVAQPTGLALSPDEKTLYVSSNSAGRVVAIELEKGAIRRFAASGETVPVNPFGVAADAEGNVYLTDHTRGRIVAFTPDNRFLRKFGEGKLDRPTGIAIDRRRQVVYVSSGAGSSSQHHRIEVFSLKGDHLRTIGTRGQSPGEFNFPANLAVSKDGELFVADMLNFRVQVFDPEGQLVSFWGQIGAGVPGTFDKLKSVALDSFGNIYTVDSAQAFVQIFNPKHQPLMAFGGPGVDPGSMGVPTAIAITSHNTIYVADFAVSLVHEYELINTSAEDSYRPSDTPAEPAPAAAPGALPGSPPASPSAPLAPASGVLPAVRGEKTQGG